ncbi:MAG TPA: Ig-like domain repeat protein [Pyrinomonadaceae bacterium]|nr:Ig-like domain repeat protein [Pyrinomonadaceae bacterium]
MYIAKTNLLRFCVVFTVLTVAVAALFVESRVSARSTISRTQDVLFDHGHPGCVASGTCFDRHRESRKVTPAGRFGAGEPRMDASTGPLLAGSVLVPEVSSSTLGFWANAERKFSIGDVPMASFVPGNLVIFRVGTGAMGLNTNATPVFLDEYTTTGTFVQSIAMPTTVSGANKRLTASGTATSEGCLSRSPDGRYVALAGYDAAVGTGSITTANASSINRVIGLVDHTGAFDTTTAFADNVNLGNARGAATLDGSNIWLATGNNSVRYSPLGGTTSTQLSTGLTNVRCVQIFDGQLYVSAATGAFRIATVGTGTPTTSGQTITNLPGFPTATTTPYGFFFADLNNGVPGLDTLFIASDTDNQIQKYSLIGGSWALSGTKALSAVRGLTGVVSGTSVTLYATTQSSLQTVTDANGYNAAFGGTLTSLATAATNTVFRGVALAPVAPLAPEINIKGNGQSIVDGDTTPDPADHTDLGSTMVSGGTVMRTFTIENAGTSDLNLTGSPLVEITGSNPSEFTVTAVPTTPIASGGGTTTFQVTFDPSSTGLREATVSIANNDADENPYTFAIQGTGTEPETTVTVSGGNLTITDGNGGTSNDDLTLACSGTNIVITDPGTGLNEAVPIADVTGSITINGLGGNDTLTVDLSGCNFIPAGGLFFNGGDPTTAPGDTLNIVGGSQGTVTYNYTNSSDGSVVMSNFGTITYTGLEPISNTGTVTDVIFNLPAAASNAVLEDDGTSGNGISRLRSAIGTFETTDFTNPTGSVTINRGNAADALTVSSLPDFDAAFAVGSATDPFDSVTFGGTVALTGANGMTVHASRTIDANNSNLTTVDGNILLRANQHAIPTTGSFVGISVGNTVIGSTTGDITLEGRGGDTGNDQRGIVIFNTTTKVGFGTTGEVTVKGFGGGTTGDSHSNFGVVVSSDAEITSGGGPVLVEGTGGGAGTGGGNVGVLVQADGRITSAGTNATVTVKGQGGGSTGNGNSGVFVHDPASRITSSGGPVLVEGTGGGSGQSDLNFGVFVVGGKINNAGTGAGSLVTVQGWGGNTAGSDGWENRGVQLEGTAEITSAGGDVLVEGTGGGSGNANGNQGVDIRAGSKITSSSATADVTVKGQGGTSSADWGNFGVYLDAVGSEITSSGGNVLVEGTGGGSGTSSNNHGVVLSNGSRIASGGSGTTTVKGFGGNNAGIYGHQNIGVLVAGANVEISSAGGTVLVEGTGGGSGNGGGNDGVRIGEGKVTSTGATASVTVKGIGGGNGSSFNNVGVIVHVGAKITTSSPSASVSVIGQGGNLAGTEGLGSHGVQVSDAGSGIFASGGQLMVDGTGGGNGIAGINVGVVVTSGAKIENTGAGAGATVTVVGKGGNLLGTGGANFGVHVRDTDSEIASSGGNISVTGQGAPGSLAIFIENDGRIDGTTGTPIVTVTGDSMDLQSNPSIDAGTNTVNLFARSAGTLINMGGGDVLSGSPLTLGLFDDELDRVIAGTLNIGKADSGSVTTTADITRGAATDMTIASGGDIVIANGQVNTGGGTLLLDPGVSPFAVKPTKFGIDTTASTLSFASDLAIEINGAAADIGYNQLNVAGEVDLTGVDLVLSGTHVPALGESFTIVENDGTDAVVGTFNGLPQGANIPGFLGSGFVAKINYAGGSGNDVVLTVGLAGAGTISFKSAPYVDNETNLDHDFAVVVQRTGGFDGNLGVNVATSAGTATPGPDYVETSCNLTFGDGDVSDKICNVTIKGDTDYEGPETVILTLTPGPGAPTIGAPNPTTLTIISEDGPSATLVVNSTADTDDGFCLPLGFGNGCTLREAINAANANGDTTTINFGIPNTDLGCDGGTDVCTISPGAQLPTLITQMFINGYSQPDSQVNTLAVGNDAIIKIRVDGNLAPAGTWGFSLNSLTGGTEISGLSVTRFDNGIVIAGSDAGTNLITGNFIGLQPDGDTASGNVCYGVALGGPNNHLGGSTPADRNLISANGCDAGVNVSGSAATANQILGNYIGTDRTGLLDRGNTANGITISLGANTNTIGGTTSASRNVLSGNNGFGVRIVDDNTANNVVLGNYIGVGADGITPLSNNGFGVTVGGNSGTSGNVIGGTAAGEGNIIAHNGLSGVDIQGSGALDTSVRGNSIFSNAGLGIDLALGGVTANDAGDPDSGPNNLQNFPVITLAHSSATAGVIAGTLNTTPNSERGYFVDFYSNTSCDASGHGEGETYLGSLTASVTDANGDVLPFTFNTGPIAVGSFITTTATDEDGNTSEFSQCFTMLDSADTPSVTNAVTVHNVQTTSGLVISRNAADGAEVTHFKITNIQNGSLFLNNGTTPVVNGQFITFAQGNAGLRFTPNLGFIGTGHFTVQASVSGNDPGLGGGTIVADIEVNRTNTTTSITSDLPDPSAISQTYSVTWNVGVVAPGIGTPTGNVLVTDGVDSCNAPVGSGSCEITSTTPGARLLVATYSGNDLFNGSVSSGESHTVCVVNPIVTNSADSGAGSLRQAVIDACPGSTITFDLDDGLTTVTSPITLTSGEIVIDKDLIIQGPGADQLTISGNNTSRIFSVEGVIDVEFIGLTLTGGNGVGSSFSGSGGAILNQGSSLSLNSLVISTNTASGFGGAIYYRGGGGSLTVTNSTLRDNTASLGGAIATGNGITSLVNSTVADNRSTFAFGTGTLELNGTVNIVNSTISGNQVPNGSGNGGALWVFGTVTVRNSTITNNSAAGVNSAGGILLVAGQVFSESTIIAANQNNATTPDVGGALTSQGYNLIGNVGTATGFTNGVNADQVGTGGAGVLDPMLGPLVDNGGPTWTHALLQGSPAIDKGKSFDLTEDQRGSGRPFDIPSTPPADGGDNSDIGAYELNTIQTSTALVSSVNPTVYGQMVIFTATVETVPPNGAPTGSVSFFDGLNPIATCQNVALASGQAQCGTSSLAVGGHTIKAEFAEDLPYVNSSGTIAHNVNKAGTTLQITGDTPDPSFVNQAYTVNWTVNVVALGAGTPTGTVMVSDGTGGTCSAPFAAGMCSLTSTSPGPKILTASYGGDSNFHGSFDDEQHTVIDPTVCTSTLTITEVFPGSIAGFTSVTAGVNSITIDVINSGAGLQNISVISSTNANISIPSFPFGTFNPVTVTYTLPIPGQTVDFTIRASARSHALLIRGQCTFPVVGPPTPTPTPTPTPSPTPTPTPTPTPPGVCTPTLTLTEVNPGSLAAFEAITAGSGTVTVDMVDSSIGLLGLTLVNASNANVNIPMFPFGTTAPVITTFTRPNPALLVDFTLRAGSRINAVLIRAQCPAVP